jgi:hypothetical protein
MAAILSEDEAEPRARAVVREMVGSWLGHPAAGPVLLSFWGLVRTNPRAAELNAAMFARYRRYSEALVRTGIERGEIRPDADPTAMAAVMVALVVGIATQELFEPDAIDVAAVVQEAGDVVVQHLAA